MRAIVLRALVPALLIAGAVIVGARADLRDANGTVVPEVDLTGRWNLLLLGGAFTTACEVQFTQNGSDVDGDWICSPAPAELTGTVRDAGEDVELVLDGMINGTAVHIEATVAPDENSADGTWTALGSEGEFSGQRKLAATATPTSTRTPTATNTSPPATPTATPTPIAPTVEAATPNPPATPGVPNKIGDANCDKDVTSIDATLVLQFSAGLLASLACPIDADVNGGGMSSVDAALILQHVAGIITFPAI